MVRLLGANLCGNLGVYVWKSAFLRRPQETRPKVSYLRVVGPASCKLRGTWWIKGEKARSKRDGNEIQTTSSRVTQRHKGKNKSTHKQRKTTSVLRKRDYKYKTCRQKQATKVTTEKKKQRQQRQQEHNQEKKQTHTNTTKIALHHGLVNTTPVFGHLGKRMVQHKSNAELPQITM